MNYAESFEYVMNIPHFAKTNTLGRIRAILSALNVSLQGERFVHVAGTNGKGSTVTMLSKILHESSLRVGTFVSPFVYDFLERIQIDCAPVSQDIFADAISRISEIADKMADRPNFFEIMCAAALTIFTEQKCDIIVLEVGLGGRWDATNVIPSPEISIITSIGLDHTALLGETLPEIAREKCGIIKSGTHVITGASHTPEVLSVIKRTCEDKNVPLSIASEEFSIISEQIDVMRLSYHDTILTLPLVGAHQRKNLALVLKAADILNIPNDVAARALKDVRFPARLEIRAGKPLVIVDGAHNPDGIYALKDAVEALLRDRRIITIFGALADKNTCEMTRTVASFSDLLIFTPPPSPRAASATELMSYASGIPTENFGDAYTFAKSQAKEDDVILICGSLYLAGEAKII